MATRDELYAKFGITAEAAQLFETELGSLLLCARGLERGWHHQGDPDDARKLLDHIDRSTLGQLLGTLKNCVSLDHGLVDRFASALKARNRLFHWFYKTHALKFRQMKAAMRWWLMLKFYTANFSTHGKSPAR
ncbi:hypothetical protein RFM99_17645 [Mesorhizobium sp. VK4C]|uniref:hypothetical protein n=1 Tax=Mesorhizobium captivum TaxID=3072319 RepID=UPI002A24BAF8|nr:hypothetical protein [Mesorhizobium sp. VK4C]MDX8500235.1 hypothetical protein [Mesorhizobium sp. VK4C]